MLKATVSGSFHRHMPAIYQAVGDLRALGVDVLSPSDPRIVDHIGEFLFVASDKLRSVKLVEDRHLEAIAQSDFLWVVCPDGYTGASTSLEIGVATAMRVPVFSDAAALDITIGQYVRKVRTMKTLVEAMRNVTKKAGGNLSFLIDPTSEGRSSIEEIERLIPIFAGKNGNGRDDAERALTNARHKIGRTFGLRTSN